MANREIKAARVIVPLTTPLITPLTSELAWGSVEEREGRPARQEVEGGRTPPSSLEGVLHVVNVSVNERATVKDTHVREDTHKHTRTHTHNT